MSSVVSLQCHPGITPVTEVAFLKDWLLYGESNVSLLASDVIILVYSGNVLLSQLLLLSFFYIHLIIRYVTVTGVQSTVVGG